MTSTQPIPAKSLIRRKSGNAWERFKPVWILVDAIFLTICAILVASDGPQPQKVWWVFALFSLWLAGLSYLDWKGMWDRSVLVAGYLALGMGIWTVLGYYNQTFFFLLSILFPAVFRLLPAVLASVMTLLLSLLWPTLSWQCHGMVWWRAYAIGLGLYLAGWTMGMFIYSIISQSISRQALVDSLKKAQDELAEAERRAGRLEERRRIANELHDTIAQCFTSVVIHLEAGEAVLHEGGKALAEHLAAAKKAARNGLGQTRSRVWALRPEQDQPLALDAALRQVAEAWSAEKKIDLDFQVTGKPDALANRDRDLILRCAREGLQNIYKHANASLVVITLSYMEDQVVLDLVDNGVGMSRSADHDGYGLAAMRYAVNARQGRVVVESEAGEGVKLAVSLPHAIEGDVSLEGGVR